VQIDGNSLYGPFVSGRLCGFFRTDILFSSVEKRLLIASNLLLLGENAKQKNGNCNNLPGILFFKSRYI
jgi:hypothetical protein